MHYLFFASLAILLWSTLAVLVTQLDHLPPFLLLAITLTIGGSLSIFRFRQWQLDWKLIVFGIAGIFGYHFLLFMALRLAAPVEANLINYLWPLLIVLLSPIYLSGFHLTSQHFIGGVMGFSGVYLLVNGPSTMELSSDSWLGYLLAFSAAIFWASYSLLSKRFSRMRTATVGLFCILGGILAFAAHCLTEPQTNIETQDWLYLTALGLGPMGIAFYAWDKGLKTGDPRTIGTLSYFTPLLSTFLLLLFGDQDFQYHLIVALVLIVGGALIGSFRFKRRNLV